MMSLEIMNANDEDDEDELRQIMEQTPLNTHYMDEEIKELFAKEEDYEVPSLNSIASSWSVEQQEFNELNARISEISAKSLQQQERQLEQPQTVVQDEKQMLPYQEIYDRLKELQKADQMKTVRKKFPMFQLSQPSYKIQNHGKEKNLAYSNKILRKNISVMDAGYCLQEKVFRVAIGTDQGSIIIFEPDSLKAQHVMQRPFGVACEIVSLKWSENLQHLVISNDLKTVKVYSFKQAISIESRVSLNILQSPVELCKLSEKQLKSLCNDIYIIHEIPFTMLLVDEDYEILKVELKKHILSIKPVVSLLPIKFNVFSELAHRKVSCLDGSDAHVVAVSGQEYVTIFILEPYFEIAMVFDKDKHGGHFRKNGFANLSFRTNKDTLKTELVIIWDKYLQILSIDIKSVGPLNHKIQILKRHFFADSTLLGGALSSTLIYQVSRIGLKVYSSNQFQKQIQAQPQSELYFKKINFNALPYGDLLEEAISNTELPLSQQRLLKGLFAVTNRRVFYSQSTSLQSYSIDSLSVYVDRLIEHGGNWKIGLQLLRDCYLGVVQTLDEIGKRLIADKLKQYALRYLSFLEVVIQSNDGDNEQMLWSQEILFVMGVLIDSEQMDLLCGEVISKIVKISPKLLGCLAPFILLNKIKKFTARCLELVIENAEVVGVDLVSKLLVALRKKQNESDFPHQVNAMLLRKELYLDIIELNHKFDDFYTPFVLLIGAYCNIAATSPLQPNHQQLDRIGRLIGYCVYDNLQQVNSHRGYTKFYRNSSQTEIIACMLPLLKERIFSILIRHQAKSLFTEILPELYSGQSLQILNEMDNRQMGSDIMQQIIEDIPYEEVVQHRCELLYWRLIFNLRQRKIIKLALFEGLQYLTLNTVEPAQIHSLQEIILKLKEPLNKELLLLEKQRLGVYFESVRHSNHIVVIEIVGKLIGQQVEVLHCMLGSSQARDHRMFGYLSEVMPLLEADKLDKMKVIFKENVKLFSSISPNAFSDLISNYYPRDLHTFVGDLAAYPHEQLRLIQAILVLHAYHTLLKDFKVRYLQLLAITGQASLILVELRREEYPLDEALHICRKYEVWDGLAFLLVRSGGEGEVAEAIRINFKMAKLRIDLAIQTNKQERLSEARIERQIRTQMLATIGHNIQICQSLTQNQADLHCQNEWFIMLEELEEFKQKSYAVYGAYIADMLRGVVNREGYPQIVRVMISQVAHRNILQLLEAEMGRMDAEAINVIILELVKSYNYEKIVSQLAQEAFIDNENINRHSLLTNTMRGFVSNASCDLCRIALPDIVMVRYGCCGHQIHPTCSQDVKNCIICCEQTATIFERCVDQKNGVKIQMLANAPAKLENKLSEVRRITRMNRLVLYDQMSTS